MSGNLWAALAGLVILGAFADWTRRMLQVRIPKNRRPFQLVMGAGVSLGILAFGLGTHGWGSFAAGFAVVGGCIFLGLQLISAQDAREPSVKLGGPILDFSAPDETGSPFQLASLAGRPFLLKFFRGHW